jgi:antitoxin component of MazEF toxin-antitoxin module
METKGTKRKAKRRAAELVGYARLSRWGNSHVVALPKNVRDALQLEVGQYLRLSTDGTRLVVVKAA